MYLWKQKELSELTNSLYENVGFYSVDDSGCQLVSANIIVKAVWDMEKA